MQKVSTNHLDGVSSNIFYKEYIFDKIVKRKIVSMFVTNWFSPKKKEFLSSNPRLIYY